MSASSTPTVLTVRGQQLDHAGGVGLSLPDTATHVVVARCDALRALEVSGGASVRTLDLSALPTDLMLYVRGLPSLVRLVLPEHGSCHVHLDLDAPPALRVENAVSWLDARWRTGRGNEEGTLSWAWNEAHAVSTLDGAWLGPLAGAPDDVDLLAVCGEPATRLDLSGHAARALVVEGCLALDELIVDAPALVAVRSAPALRRLVVGRASHACIDAAPVLGEVAGDGERLTLRDSAAVPELVIRGTWSEVSIHRMGPAALRAPRVDRVITELTQTLPASVRQGRDAGASTRASATSLETELRSMCRQLELGLSPTQREIAALVRLSSGAAAQRTLEALAAVGARARPRELWLIRDRVARRRGRKPAGPASWHWDFGVDLADRGWRADLRLWLRCREESGVARDFEAVIRASSGAAHLATIADAAQASDLRAHQALLLDVLGAQLAHGVAEAMKLAEGEREVPGGASGARGSGARRQRRRRGGAALEVVRRAEDPVLVATLRLVVRAMLRLRQLPEMRPLLAQFCAWLRWCCAPGTGIVLLGLLHGFGSTAASTTLVELIADPELHEVLRHKASMARLNPIEENLLG